MLFLGKKSVGLDISDRTIEVVELEKISNDYRVLKKNRIDFEAGVIKKGRIKNEEKLIKIVQQALSQAKPEGISEKKIIFGLPENLVFTYIFSLPARISGKNEIYANILEKASQVIPLGKNDYQLEYKIMESSRGKQALLVAVSKEALWEWKKFFKKCNLDPDIFDLETMANFRGLYHEASDKPVCLVDMGETTTGISMFNKNGLMYSYSIFEAGDYFTKKIAEELDINYEEAEKQKIKNGLSEKNKKIKKSLSEALTSVINEVNISLTFYEEKYKEKISEVVFVGGSSKIIGLVDFLKEHIKKPLKIGRPRLAKENISVEYLGAVGLAFKNLEKRWQEKDPEFSIKNIQVVESFAEKNKVISKPQEDDSEELSVSDGASEDKQEIKKILDDLSESNLKIKKQLFLLAGIVVFGIIIVSLAFWYKNSESGQNYNSGMAEGVYSQTQILDLQIPIAVSVNERTADRVPGRLIKNTITDNLSYEEAVDFSRSLANAELKEGEWLSVNPINQIDQANLIFPLNVEWIAFDKKEADSLFIQKIKKINNQNIPFILSSVSPQNVLATENPNIYLLNGEIKIFTNEVISY